MHEVPLQLFDPRLGQPALKVEPLGVVVVGGGGGGAAGIDLEHPQRSSYFTVVWVRRGAGVFWADLARHLFNGPTLLFAVPYQIVRIEASRPLDGVVIQFHANFLCVETYHREVGCNGVLFNQGCGAPLVRAADPALAAQLAADVDALRSELREEGLAHNEALISQLKLLLIRATRAKLRQQNVALAPDEGGGDSRFLPPAIAALPELIESRYRELRRPSDYARLLHVSPKTLAKLVKTHLGTTLTQLLRERVVRQAKWDMLHTTKQVKQVAAELGFDDVFYFSRLFKRATGCSPAFFREHETAIRGGRNLSM
jgi:AraC-like DNA-binding protein